MPTLIEMIAILSISVSLPTLAMAMWHGWKIEQHRSEQENAPDEGGMPWN